MGQGVSPEIPARRSAYLYVGRDDLGLERDVARYRFVFMTGNEGPPDSLDPTRIELLADELEMGPEELREYLRQKIAERSERIGSSSTWRDGGVVT